MILDFHTHAFPDPLAERAIAHLEELGGIDAYTDGTLGDLKRSMKDAGVTHSVLCNIVVKPGQTAKVYEFAKQIRKEESNIFPLASIHPKEENWKEWLKTFAADGFKGIKLHPGYQQFFINDPELEAFYREAFAQGLFIMFHAGWDAGYPSPMHASPRRVYDILPVLEEGTTILAHLGGNMRPKEVTEMLAGRNLYFDTAYSLEKIALEDLKAIFRKHGPERMLFGSDAPWADQVLYVKYFLERLVPGFLSPQDEERVLWSNGASLLGIV